MEQVKSVLLIAPTDRKFKISFTCDDSKSDLELIRTNFEDICRKDFALRQVFDNSESHFIFKKYDDLFKCEIEVTDTDTIEHGSVLHVTIISTILADITLSQTGSSVTGQQEGQRPDDSILSPEKERMIPCTPKPVKALEFIEHVQAQTSNVKSVFHIVKFLDSREVDIVPESWLNKDLTMCSYPNYKSVIKLAQAVKTSEQIGKGWKVRPVTGLKAFDSYEKASAGTTDMTELTSDLNSASSDVEKERKQRRKLQKNQCESSDSEIERSYKKGRKVLLSPSPVQEIMPVFKLEPRSVEQNEMASSPGSSFTSDLLYQDTLTPQHQIRTMEEIPFQMKVIQWMAATNAKLDEIKNLRVNYLASQLVDVESTMDLPRLPVATREELSSLNEYLETATNFKKMVGYLSGKGGHNLDHSTRRMMKCLITVQLASECNWAGRGEKLAFKETKVKELVIYSVRQIRNCKDAQECEIENCIKSFFKYAPSRVKYACNKIQQ